MSRPKLPPHRIEYAPDWRELPMAYWVHVECDGDWRSAGAYDPPAPRAHGRQGYPVLYVDVGGGEVMAFSSKAQWEEAIRVLASTPMPSVRRLAAMRPGGAGPNRHWLSRLPAPVKSRKGRESAVQRLRALAGHLPFA